MSYAELYSQYEMVKYGPISKGTKLKVIAFEILLIYPPPIVNP